MSLFFSVTAYILKKTEPRRIVNPMFRQSEKVH